MKFMNSYSNIIYIVHMNQLPKTLIQNNNNSQELILLSCVNGDAFSSHISMTVVMLAILIAFDKSKVGLIRLHALLYSICLLHLTNPTIENWKSFF